RYRVADSPLVRKLKIQPPSLFSNRKRGLNGLGGESLMATEFRSTNLPVFRSSSDTICGAMARESSRFRPPQLIESFMGRVLPIVNGLGGKGRGRGSSSGFNAAMGKSRPTSPS